MGVGSCEDLLKSNTKIPEPALARILFCAVQGVHVPSNRGAAHARPVALLRVQSIGLHRMPRIRSYLIQHAHVVQLFVECNH